MKNILVTVSSLTAGSGLSKYVCTLSRILSTSDNQITILTTHTVDLNYEQEIVKSLRNTKLVSFGEFSKLSKYLKVWAYIQKTHPDVIINNYNAVIQYLLPFISNKIKVIHILHNNTNDFYRIGAINGNRVNGWIAPTKAIADNFNIYSGNKYKNKVVVIPHGVEAAIANNNDSRTVKNLVFVGVLYEHKGAHILPTIIQKLKEKHEKFHFTIIGGGILKDQLHDQLFEDISKGLVTMTGVIPAQKVYEILSQSDIFVYPTHLDAFGLVIAEAMMNKVVPVVTLLPGITDNLVDHKINGFLLEQDNVDSFVDTISNLLHNEKLLAQLKIAAAAKANNYFSMEVMKNNYSKYLDYL